MSSASPTALRLSVEPDVISFADCSAPEPEQALQLLREMQRQSVKPDVISYNAAISACEKGAQPEQAVQLLRAMQQQSVEPDVIRCSASISACEKRARPEQALRLLREMERQSVEPHVISYNDAFSACEMTQVAASRRCPTFFWSWCRWCRQDWESFFSSWCFHRLIQQPHPGHRPQVGSGISCRCPSCFGKQF